MSTTKELLAVRSSILDRLRQAPPRVRRMVSAELDEFDANHPGVAFDAEQDLAIESSARAFA